MNRTQFSKLLKKGTKVKKKKGKKKKGYWYG